MNFYVIEITTGDDKVKGQGIYVKDTLKEAMSTYHQKMSTAMKSDLYESEQIMVINSDNGIHVQDKYVNEDYVAPHPEPVVVDELPMDFEVPVMDDVPVETNDEDLETIDTDAEV